MPGFIDFLPKFNFDGILMSPDASCWLKANANEIELMAGLVRAVILLFDIK
ncbi:hypothetical protein C4K40_4884 [Pseudomonas sp. CMR5c]|nr:hypothetical protein C4K40_4884 [Pseudomonas sp. CMR5c]